MHIDEPLFANAKVASGRQALSGDGRSWTYGEVAARAEAVAAALLHAGVVPGEAVAIYAHRRPELLWTYCGVLRAGGIAVVLDALYPRRRLAAYLSHVRPRAIVSTGPEGRLPSGLAEFLPPETQPVALAGVDVRAARLRPGTRSGCADAYVVFTSGTTGTPNAVLVPHAPVAHFLDWHIRTFALGADDVFALLAGLGHDPAARDVFTPLWLGARLAVPSVQTWARPKLLCDWLEANCVTVVHLTPTLGRLLARSGARPLEHLRYVFFGGELLSTDLVHAFRAFAPRAALVNFYGTTETPQVASYFAVDELPADDIVPIGQGIDEWEVVVRDRTGREPAARDVGEICVVSHHLPRGYLGADQLSAERFVDVDSGDAAGRTMYRTGDLGCRLPDGNVVVVGRADRQVKINGVRVELDEVEHHLRAMPRVADAAVAWAVGEGRIVAFVSGDDPPARRELRAFLGRRLPPGAVPATFVAVDALPRTPNGKVDRAALVRGHGQVPVGG